MTHYTYKPYLFLFLLPLLLLSPLPPPPYLDPPPSPSSSVSVAFKDRIEFVNKVAEFKDPRDACAAIVTESYRLWLQYETRTDDFTVIVAHISGLADMAVGQSASYGTSV